MPKGRPKGSKNKIQNGKYVVCPTCKEKFYVSMCRIGERKYCSKKCRTVTKATRKYISLSHLNGIRYGDTRKWSGYIYVYCPKHPFAHHGYVKKATLVMEKHIGRYIKPPKIIHHVNGIKTGGRLENLQLCANHSEHRHAHKK